MGESKCPGCGLVLPSAGGAAHPYMTASPECWSAYALLLAAQYANPARMRFHQLVVDAYAVQHPGAQGPEPDRRAIQSVGMHLMTLCLFLEHSVDPSLGTSLHKSMAERPAFTYLPAPDHLGFLTHAAVPLDGDPTAARAAVYGWAQSVWDAWFAHQATVRGWLITSGLLIEHPGGDLVTVQYVPPPSSQ